MIPRYLQLNQLDQFGLPGKMSIRSPSIVKMLQRHRQSRRRNQSKEKKSFNGSEQIKETLVQMMREENKNWNKRRFFEAERRDY